jgi:ferrous iron transport protein A
MVYLINNYKFCMWMDINYSGRTFVMTVTSLDKLAPGEAGRIRNLTGRGAIRRRLVDMGLTTGAVIEMVKVSPLGDPVEFRLRDYHLSLRRSEAEMIEVELIREHIPVNEKTSGNGRALPLAACRSGQQVVILQTRGGRRISQRLKALGLIPGAELQIINNDFPGPLIISGGDGTRKILGRGMAMHVLVKPS